MIWARVKAWFYGAVAAVAVAFSALLYMRGKRDAKRDLELDDYEHAEDIRRRVSVDRDQRMRDLDGAGWRD